MDRGYVLRFDEGYAIDEEEVSSSLSLNKKRVIELADYLVDSVTIDAKKVIDLLFPEVNADVFISHSHKDVSLATQLAIDISNTKGMGVFVDSCVWGSSSKLLKIINDRFCKIPGSSNYDYEKVMRTSSHVNMILTTALQRMMDSASNFIFLDSESSLIQGKFWEDEVRTDSAWIHMELKFSELLSDRRFVTRAAFESMDDLSFAHPAPTEHLEKVSAARFYRWLLGESSVL
ncbi:hypothetical protein [Pseudomonas sp. W15Feb9B]|uniref:hypothetical protein n=1 Tax=Pseudomonas sp. W15Feb9B TaxID=550743 RepID=UPI000697EE5A|nr:hypothetical protein [Pseudomonas sp. W15Feb9B]